MNWLKQLLSRHRLYGDLSEEIREHLEEKVELLVRNGMSRKDAEFAARREFGNVTLVEEGGRDVWRWPSLENLLGDVRYGFRMLRNKPNFFAWLPSSPWPWGLARTPRSFPLSTQRSSARSPTGKRTA